MKTEWNYPSTTQQLWRAIYSFHRSQAWMLEDVKNEACGDIAEARRAIVGERQEAQLGAIDVLKVFVRDERKKTKTLYIGFGVCAALIMGSTFVLNRDDRRLEKKADDAAKEADTVLAVGNDLYKVLEQKTSIDGKCHEFTINRVGETTGNGKPFFAEEKEVTRFRIPIDCKL